MARLLPQRALHHVGRVHLDIAPRVLAAAHIADQSGEQSPALGMPEHGARRLLLEMEQIHLAPQAPVVALLGLIELMQIGRKVVLARPRRAVDALEHGLGRIPAPIGAGDLEQLEAFADLARRGHMRAPAEIEPVALRVELDLLALGNRVDQLELEVFALLLEERLRGVAIDDLAGEGPVARDDLRHLRLDPREIVGRERLLAREVVIEAVVDHRADGDLRAGIKLLHRFRHHMRRVVADERERVFVLARQEFDGGVRPDGGRKIRAAFRRGSSPLCAWQAKARSTWRHRARWCLRAPRALRHREMSGRCQTYRLLLSLLRTSAGKRSVCLRRTF